MVATDTIMSVSIAPYMPWLHPGFVLKITFSRPRFAL
jgi:hypothetical protein